MTTRGRWWWLKYPRPVSPIERAAEQLELKAIRARPLDEERARARYVTLTVKLELARALADERGVVLRTEPNDAFADAVTADPYLPIRIGRAIRQEIARQRALAGGL